ncbi:MAG: hypothetical protein ACNA8W_14380 [Bradymonadaceae bacterium]
MDNLGTPSAQTPGPTGPPAPHVPQAAPPAAKGFPWGKVLAGCGCLSFVALIVVGVVGFFAWKAGSEAMDDLKDDFGFISEMQETGKSQGASKSSSKTSGKKGERSPTERSSDALDAEKVRAYLQKPLTRAEVREFNKFVESWKKDPAYVRWEKETKGLEEFGKKNKGKETSVAEQLRGVRQGARTMTAMTELIQAFDEHVQKNGGYEKHYSSTLRISGLHVASETVAKQHKNKNQHSDEVSKLMIKERPEIAKEYQGALKDAREASARAKNKDSKDMAAYQAMMAMMGGGPGTIALARMPAQTFNTWDGLSEAQRKELSENLTTAFGAASWFGAGLHPVCFLPWHFRRRLASSLSELGGDALWKDVFGRHGPSFAFGFVLPFPTGGEAK